MFTVEDIDFGIGGATESQGTGEGGGAGYVKLGGGGGGADTNVAVVENSEDVAGAATVAGDGQVVGGLTGGTFEMEGHIAGDGGGDSGGSVNGKETGDGGETKSVN